MFPLVDVVLFGLPGFLPDLGLAYFTTDTRPIHTSISGMRVAFMPCDLQQSNSTALYGMENVRRIPYQVPYQPILRDGQCENVDRRFSESNTSPRQRARKRATD